MTKPIKKIIDHQARYSGVDFTIDELNAIFTPLTFQERIRKLYDYFDCSDVLCTSSFGTKSVFLLHLLHQIYPKQQVHFINTTYHFPATLAYKARLEKQLNLQIIDVYPNAESNRITANEAWWKEHPRMCCTINKISPLDPIVAAHSVWISGLMGYQTDFRSRLEVFEQRGDIIKFHPLIDVDEGEFLYHLDYYKLPQHPLEKEGYGSIGCTHCTLKGEGRSGRWSGTGKSECGLHPNFYKK